MRIVGSTSTRPHDRAARLGISASQRNQAGRTVAVRGPVPARQAAPGDRRLRAGKLEYRRGRAPLGPRAGLRSHLHHQGSRGPVTFSSGPCRGPRGSRRSVMPYLPVRPDLDQLQHQAKDLLHAAKRGDSGRSRQMHAVSGPGHLVVGAAGDGPRVRARQLGQPPAGSRAPRACSTAGTCPGWPATGQASGNGRGQDGELDATHRCADTGGRYMAMLRFDHGRLGLPAELPGTGRWRRPDPRRAPSGQRGARGRAETPLITTASYGDAEVARC